VARKLFKHNTVEKIKLGCENTPTGRFYTTPSGGRYKSVTTILGEKLDHSWLDAWKKRVGEKEAARISEIATRRGNIIHNMAERYVLNENDYLSGSMPTHAVMFNGIKDVLDKHVDNIYGVEIPLYSAALKAAGRTDLIAEFDGVTSIIDYKTSKKLKSESDIEGYFLQSTVYSMMFEILYGIKTPQIAIVIAVDHEPKAQVFLRDRSLYVKRAIEIFA
jgi:genome maintenance exonuclease 1